MFLGLLNRTPIQSTSFSIQESNMRHLAVFFSISLSLAAAFHAFAQPGGPPGGGPGGPGGPRGGGRGGPGRGGAPSVEASVTKLMGLDQDKDGKLSKSEVSDSRLQALFERADADKDGVVTRDEATKQFTAEAAALGDG